MAATSAANLSSLDIKQGDLNQNQKKENPCKVNREYVPVKILFFACMAGQSSVLYKPVFMKHLGLSTTQNGIIWAIDRVVGIFVPPMLGAAADKTRRPKTVIQVVFASAMLLCATMYFIPIEETGYEQSTSCFNASCYERRYPNVSQCNIDGIQRVPDCPVLRNATPAHSTQTTHTPYKQSNSTCLCTQSLEEVDQDQYGVTFWAMLTLTLLTSTAMFGMHGVIDAFILNKFTAAERHKFGKNRLWGAVGFGTGALLVGFAKGCSTVDNDKNLKSNIFSNCLAALGLEGNVLYIPFAFSPLFFWSILLVAFRFIDSSQAEMGDKTRFADLKIIFSDMRMVVFMFLMFVLGYVVSIGESYMFWYGEEKFDAPGTIMGISVVTASTFDVIMFLLSGRIIGFFGANLVMAAGVFLMGLRLLCYTAATQAWHLVASETLRGLSWAVTWIAVCLYVADTVPPELRATTMGAVNAIMWAIGYGSGGLLGGLMYQNLGPDNMFRISFVASTVATAGYLLFYFCYERPRKKQISSTRDLKLEVKPDDGGGESECGESLMKRVVTDADVRDAA